MRAEARLHRYLSTLLRCFDEDGCRVRVVASGLGFGLPCVFAIRHLARTGQVWTFMGYPTYGHGPFEQIGLQASVPLLVGFLAVCLAEVALAVILWAGHPSAPALSHALLPLELVFWIEFALPFGLLLGLARTVLLLVA